MEYFDLFNEHVRHKEKLAWELIQNFHYDSIVIDSGCQTYFYGDDQPFPYRAAPEFRSWCPEKSPGSLIVVEPGKQAVLIQIQFDDFWHAPPIVGKWADAFEVKIVNSRKQALECLKDSGHNLWVGPGEELNESKSWDLNPAPAIAWLDWQRCLKTAYETACLRKANELASEAHKSAKKAFLDGKSEFEIYQSYLEGARAQGEELPYSAIIGLDKNAGVLHYQYKSKQKLQSQVLLVDAGVTFQCYGSDITRTWVHEDRTHSVFQSILKSLDGLQQKLASHATEDMGFADLHIQSVEGIGQILLDHDVIRNVEPSSDALRKVVRAFYPHGLGHMLGVLVHDVGGRQLNEKGEPCPQHPMDPNLRTNRPLRNQEVVTIEPGIYWIPMLLKQHDQSLLNHSLIQELIPLGGMRIEDNVVVGSKPENLTRPFLP